jgi:putative thioredoxin
VERLIEIVRRDRTWTDDGARKQLLQFFDAWGPMDPVTIAGRRKLSAILFR